MKPFAPYTRMEPTLRSVKWHVKEGDASDEKITPSSCLSASEALASTNCGHSGSIVIDIESQPKALEMLGLGGSLSHASERISV